MPNGTLGFELRDLEIAVVHQGSSAAGNGLRGGMMLLRVDEKPVVTNEEAQQALAAVGVVFTLGVTELTEVAEQLHPCQYCGRKFTSSRLAKHELTCAKRAGKEKRVAFDTKRARLRDLGMEHTRARPEAPKSQENSGPAKWRQEHDDLMAMLKGRGQAQDNRVTCPCCERKFSAEVAEKHIPWCKEKSAKVAMQKPRSVHRPSEASTAKSSGRLTSSSSSLPSRRSADSDTRRARTSASAEPTHRPRPSTSRVVKEESASQHPQAPPGYAVQQPPTWARGEAAVGIPAPGAFSERRH